MKKVLFFAILLSNSIFAQKKEEPVEQSRSVIKVYTPSEAPKDQAGNGYKWTVKTDLLSVISGEFPVIAEYRIGKKISLEGSAGITYGYLGNSLFLGDDDGFAYGSSTAAMGSAFRFGFKFYPSYDYDAIEGWAFGIQVFTRTNNQTYSESFDFPGIEGELDSRNKTGASVTISKQIYWDSNIGIEYFLGLGFAKVTRDYFEQNFNNINNPPSKVTKVETLPNLQLGIRIGFGN